MVTVLVLFALGATATPPHACAPFPSLIASSTESASPFVLLMPEATDWPATVDTYALRGISPREHISRRDICTPVACMPVPGAEVGCEILAPPPPPAPFC